MTNMHRAPAGSRTGGQFIARSWSEDNIDLLGSNMGRAMSDEEREAERVAAAARKAEREAREAEEAARVAAELAEQARINALQEAELATFDRISFEPAKDAAVDAADSATSRVSGFLGNLRNRIADRIDEFNGTEHDAYVDPRATGRMPKGTPLEGLDPRDARVQAVAKLMHENGADDAQVRRYADALQKEAAVNARDGHAA